jgi:hypothetical protein
MRRVPFLAGTAIGAAFAMGAMGAMVEVPGVIAEASAGQTVLRPGPAPEEVAVRGLLARQLARFPAMEPQDVYKLLYQATMGSRHAGLDSAMADQWLEREVRELGPALDEPATDTISADGRMVRVNLRPYLAAGGDRAALLRAFVRTAREFRGSTADLRRQLGYVVRMASDGEIRLPAGALRRYFARMRAAGYPAVEHSSAYVAAYRPAYRVVLGAVLP